MRMNTGKTPAGWRENEVVLLIFFEIPEFAQDLVSILPINHKNIKQ